jgi:hypothetical protein
MGTALPDGRLQWMNNRKRRTDTFAQVLPPRQETELFATEIHRLFVTPQEKWTAELRELSQHNRELTLQLIADLHNSHTEQRREQTRRAMAGETGSAGRVLKAHRRSQQLFSRDFSSANASIRTNS